MVTLQQPVIEEAAERGRSLLARELVTMVERRHDTERPGITRETLHAYVTAVRDEMAGGPDVPFDPNEFEELVEERLNSDESWVGDGYYRVGDGRVSVFPKQWHERLGGETDVRLYVEVLTAGRGDDDARTSMGGAGRGVPQDFLLDAMAVIGGVDPDEAQARIERLRAEGVLAEDADQHPNPHVRLAE
ncbi:hypothetical protein [Haloarchaeobius sp. DFWS5]|uniref:hypothetical protein n=1 Tax=Haloarchaeobius sp. DFWS5 TaxID=3446114 RepID=UPI003EBB3364